MKMNTDFQEFDGSGGFTFHVSIVPSLKQNRRGRNRALSLGFGCRPTQQTKPPYGSCRGWISMILDEGDHSAGSLTRGLMGMRTDESYSGDV